MASQDDPPKRGWRSIRFTLGELFLLFAGLALGLAYARVDGSDRWHDFLLAIFGGCFVVGLVQKSWRTWSLRRSDASITFVDATWPLTVAALMVFCGVMHAAFRHNWWTTQDFDYMTFWPAGDLTDTAFYLAVICGYFQVRQMPRAQGWGRWMALLLNGSGLLLGAYWLLVLLEEGMLLIALVHTAIAGVELAQPTRLAGKPFYPANVHTELTHQFVTRAYWTAAVLAGAFAANISLARTWSRGWWQRVLWSVVCTLLLILAWRLNWWCVHVAFPTLSPFFYSAAGTLPPANFLITGVIVLTASGAFAARACAVPRSGPSAPPSPPSTAPLCLHEWIFVPALYLLGGFGYGLVSAGEYFGGPGNVWKLPYWLVQAVAGQPRWIIWLASIILIGQRIWRWSRGRQQTNDRWSVPTARFAAVWYFALLTGLLMIPAASWLGFALYLRWRGP